MHKVLATMISAFILLGGGSVAAQSNSSPQHSFCQRVSSGPERIFLANSGTQNASNQDKSEIRITYLSHASFRIETQDGLEISTDYTGFDGSLDIPDVATMNTIHNGHFTLTPNADIQHVLHGWKDYETKAIATHYLRIGDTIIRNVTTDFDAPHTGFRPDENSIFVFEVAGLCIGHLGHLHKVPTDEQIAKIGLLDVVLFPVSGLRQFRFEGMQEIVRRLGANLIIPMHWYDLSEFHSFLNRIEGHYRVDGRNENSAQLSLRSLPNEPTMLILTPETSFGLFPE